MGEKEGNFVTVFRKIELFDDIRRIKIFINLKDLPGKSFVWKTFSRGKFSSLNQRRLTSENT